MADHIVIVMRVNIGVRDLRKRLGADSIYIGDRQKAHRRMSGRELSSQRPDAAGANHRDAQFRSRIAHFTPAPLLRSISWCPDSEVRTHLRHALMRTSEPRDTSNSMILVPLLNPKSQADSRLVCANFGFGALGAKCANWISH